MVKEKNMAKLYRYETHLHTSPVSKCALATVRESLEFYKSLGYDGVFITNHFIDGNINIKRTLPYEERINFYFSDYEEGLRLSKEIGIKVLCGVEMSYKGTDFLIYGLDKEWFLAHPEIEGMEKNKKYKLAYLIKHGAFVVHAHPYRDSSYIDHIRLFPSVTQGVEIYNANRTELENTMAELYAKNYGFAVTAGSDNHVGGNQKKLGGVQFDTPRRDELDFVERIKNGEGDIFKLVIE